MNLPVRINAFFGQIRIFISCGRPVRRTVGEAFQTGRSRPGLRGAISRKRGVNAPIFCFLFSVFCFLFALPGCNRDAKPNGTPPDNYPQAVALFYKGLISLEVSDDGNATTVLPQTTQLIPQEPAAWANLGLFQLRQGHFEEARKSLTKARELAPKSGPIAALMGLLESRQGHFAEAVTNYKNAVALAPDDLRARYALIEALGQQAGPDAATETAAQLNALAQAAPDNLFVAFERLLAAAKSNDAATIKTIIAAFAALSSAWPADAKTAFRDAQAAAGGDPRGLVGPVTGLRHTLESWPEYQRQKNQIVPPAGVVGTPIDRFLVLPAPSATPAPPDLALTYQAAPVSKSDANAPPLPANIGPHGVLALDWRNNFQTNYCYASANGLKFYEQAAGGYADVTAKTKLPAAVLNRPYTGAWAIDFDGDGDLDIALAAATGPVSVLRNNNDGTWTETRPFGAGFTGAKDFAWADFDGDGLPDAAWIDGKGRVAIFENKRSGHFAAWPAPKDIQDAAALAVVNSDRPGQMALTVLHQSGAIVRLTRSGETWDSVEIAKTSAPAGKGNARLLWADLDNNGGLDLIVSAGGKTQIFLSDEKGALSPLPALLDGEINALDDTANDGKLILTGAISGKPMRWTPTATKNYGWQRVRLRAAAVGDNRNNSYGIGAELELRAGLLYTKQVVNSPVTHFGLGTNPKADYIRMLWTNGTPQGEFDLKPDQTVDAPERLKGSCPWLFADDGTGMKFVTDLIWRSPLGLRLNAQKTAGVVQTRDWVKIRGDQLKPIEGFYHLNVTAELWETHFFDLLELLTVDHPAGTAIFADERFAIPPPPLQAEVMSPPAPAAKVTDDRGQDVTAAAQKIDGSYLDTFGRGRYQGVTRDHWAEIELGAAVPKDRKFWLIAYGWVHPTDSSINIAISQGTHDAPRDLSLEVPDGKGGWRVVRPHLGFPEGKNKTCLIDLTGLFPVGAKPRVRLRTNLEIFWDFLGSASGLPADQEIVSRVPLSSADLRFRGYSVTQKPNASSPEIPEYAIAGTAPRWLDLTGYYTRYGDVRELLTKVDDRYVIMNAGDEMALQFPAQAAPPPGWVRDYILVGDGWVKDGDFNTGFSKTVLPLPAHDRPDYSGPVTRLEDDPMFQKNRRDWQTYQTRYVTPDAFRALSDTGK